MFRYLSSRPMMVVAIGAAVVGSVVVGCSEEPSFRELTEGVPVDPSSYELSEVSCVREDDRVALRAEITNTGDEPTSYRIRYEFTKADGSKTGIVNEGASARPGQTVDISSYTGRPEDYDAEPDCSVEVFRSALEGLD